MALLRNKIPEPKMFTCSLFEKITPEFILLEEETSLKTITMDKKSPLLSRDAILSEN